MFVLTKQLLKLSPRKLPAFDNIFWFTKSHIMFLVRNNTLGGVYFVFLSFGSLVTVNQETDVKFLSKNTETLYTFEVVNIVILCHSSFRK